MRRDHEVSNSAWKALANLLSSERFPSRVMPFAGSRRISRGVVRKTAQASGAVAMVIAAESSSPRLNFQAPALN
jgi:hypothetical protein